MIALRCLGKEMTSYLDSDSLMASLNSFSVNTGSCEHPFIAQVELVPGIP